jgi:hypothetical protein
MSCRTLTWMRSNSARGCGLLGRPASLVSVAATAVAAAASFSSAVTGDRDTEMYFEVHLGEERLVSPDTRPDAIVDFVGNAAGGRAGTTLAG